jgi:hypothetical protein
MLAETCITYLSFDGLASSRCCNSEELYHRAVEYKLFNYAVIYRAKHLRSYIAAEEDEASLLVLAMQFLRNPKLC